MGQPVSDVAWLLAVGSGVLEEEGAGRAFAGPTPRYEERVETRAVRASLTIQGRHGKGAIGGD